MSSPHVSLPEHLGNVDYSRVSCNPAYNAAKDRQASHPQPTTEDPCP